jgi:MFS family permease
MHSDTPHLLTSTVIAPLSEMYGRLPLYHTCNFFFIVFAIACAVSTNMGMFIAFRFLMGCECFMVLHMIVTLTL